MAKNNTYMTGEITFASYLVSKGYEIKDIIKTSRRIRWVFNISSEDVAREEMSWPTSESARYNSAFQTLKTHIQKGGKNAY